MFGNADPVKRQQALQLMQGAVDPTLTLDQMLIDGDVDAAIPAGDLTKDHPHIRQAYEGFNRNGLAVKLNPSPATLVALQPALAGRTDLPDLAFNSAPADWSVPDYCVPEDAIVNLTTAGVLEITALISGE